MQRTVQGGDASPDREVDIGKGRGHHQRGEGTGIHAVVGMQDQRNIHHTLLFRRRNLARGHIDVVGRVAQLRVGLKGQMAIAQPTDPGSDGRHASDQMNAGFDALGIIGGLLGILRLRGAGLGHFESRGILDERLPRRIDADRILVGSQHIGSPHLGIGHITPSEVLTHKVGPDTQRGHRVHLLHREAHQHAHGLRQVAVLDQLALETVELLGGRQATVEQQVGDLLETRTGAEVEDVIAAIDQASLLAIHIPHLGFTSDGPFKAGADCRLHRPGNTARRRGLSFTGRLFTCLDRRLANRLVDPFCLGVAHIIFSSSIDGPVVVPAMCGASRLDIRTVEEAVKRCPRHIESFRGIDFLAAALLQCLADSRRR